ncbi:MAG: helix-turn-helix domain-containing protein [archaeon]|jgi:sugar-specific transcriptional regulator TrmB
MEEANLANFGLKEKESEVYLALLKSGPSLANKLAKKTNLLRTTVYDYLDALIEKGFATYTIQGGKKYFSATNPEKLLETFEEKKNAQENTLKILVSQLKTIANTDEKKVKVDVFEGKEGMKTAFNQILRANPKVMISYGSSGSSYRLLPIFMEQWHKQRIKQKLLLKVIYNDVPSSYERVEKGPKLELSEVRIFPITNFSLMGTILYNETVLLTFWDSESPLAISIQSKEMSKNYKDNFEILWKNAKKINSTK